MHAVCIMRPCASNHVHVASGLPAVTKARGKRERASCWLSLVWHGLSCNYAMSSSCPTWCGVLCCAAHVLCDPFPRRLGSAQAGWEKRGMGHSTVYVP